MVQSCLVKMNGDWRWLLKLMQMRMNACTWCPVGKGICIHDQGRGIAEKQNREFFHFVYSIGYLSLFSAPTGALYLTMCHNPSAAPSFQFSLSSAMHCNVTTIAQKCSILINAAQGN